METQRKDLKISCAVYEMFGTAFVTYALLVTGLYIPNIEFEGLISTAAFIIAHVFWWVICSDVSGGHFNPAITLSCLIASKDPKGNFATALLMIIGQFVGSLLGLLWAWLSLCDYKFLNRLTDSYPSGFDVERQHSIPAYFVRAIYPMTPVGVDNCVDGAETACSRNWGVFFATLVSSFMLCLAFAMVKFGKSTAGVDKGVKILFSVVILEAAVAMNGLFALINFNPFICFSTLLMMATQLNKEPEELDPADKHIFHYFWFYSWVPFVGAFIAGIVALIYQKISQAGDEAIENEDLKEDILK